MEPGDGPQVVVSPMATVGMSMEAGWGEGCGVDIGPVVTVGESMRLKGGLKLMLVWMPLPGSYSWNVDED